ncbi:MAG: DUF3667 domain-containing protein [Gammaproteobacteria bacterium]
MGEIAQTCRNCKALVVGKYCHQCGQEVDTTLRNAIRMFGEGVGEMFEFDSRVRRTFFPLLFKPGYLSLEWVAGRRQRYVRPVRLYLFVSIVFFIAFTIATDFDADVLREQFVERPAATDAPTSSEAEPKRRRWIEDAPISLPFYDEAQIDALKDRLDWLADNPDQLIDQARSLAPQMMFVLLPLFALILKFLYLFARRFYAEHLVLALHTHSFLFLAFLTLIALAGIRGWAAEQVAAAWVGIPAGVLTVALWFWIPVYLFLAQKRFYGQGWFFTFIKYLMTGFLYFMMVIFALMGLLVLSVMTA